MDVRKLEELTRAIKLRDKMATNKTREDYDLADLVRLAPHVREQFFQMAHLVVVTHIAQLENEIRSSA